MKFHRQCVLESTRGGSKRVMVTWVPEIYATLGHELTIQTAEGLEPGWRVTHVGGRLRSKAAEHRLQQVGAAAH